MLDALQVKTKGQALTPAMEGLYFEVKPRKDEPMKSGSSEKPPLRLTSNHRSCPSLSPLSSSSSASFQRLTSTGRRNTTWGEKVVEEREEEEEVVHYKLTLIGSLPVHHLTTMAMLPWVVAEISRCHSSEKDQSQTRATSPGQQDTSRCSHTVFLCVSASWVRCMSVLGEKVVWDPLTHTVLFECRPHRVTKLIHNSQEPRSFGCLVRETTNCACYVFQCRDSTKVRVCANRRQDNKHKFSWLWIYTCKKKKKNTILKLQFNFSTDKIIGKGSVGIKVHIMNRPPHYNNKLQHCLDWGQTCL